MKRKIFPLHNIIKQLRLERDWDQEWLSQAAGISKRTYQRIESGEGCSLETLKSIASVFEQHFTTLMPKLDTVDTYKPSWLKLIKYLAVHTVLKPLLLSVCTFILVTFFFGTTYILETSGISDSTFWHGKQLTDDELVQLHEKINESNQRRVQQGAEPLFKPIKLDKLREPLSEKEVALGIYSSSLYIFFALFFLFFMLCITNVYSRDFEMLIARPMERKIYSIFQRIVPSED